MQRSEALAVLGLNEDFQPEDLKLAYRQAAKRLHPDVNSNDRAGFEHLSAAHELLRNPQNSSARARASIGKKEMPFLRTLVRAKSAILSGVLCFVLAIVVTIWAFPVSVENGQTDVAKLITLLTVGLKLLVGGVVFIVLGIAASKKLKLAVGAA